MPRYVQPQQNCKRATNPPQKQPPAARHIDLHTHGISTPHGWSNNPSDLDLDFHFVPGESVHGVLEHYGFRNIKPVIMDHGDEYIIAAEKNGKRCYFTWNYLCDKLGMVVGEVGLEAVVSAVGRGVKCLEVVYIAYPEE